MIGDDGARMFGRLKLFAREEWSVDGVRVVPMDISEFVTYMSSVDGEPVRWQATTTVSGVTVSTAFIGVRQVPFEADLWYETMTFGGDHNAQTLDRYPTRVLAEVGHAEHIADLFRPPWNTTVVNPFQRQDTDQ